MTIIAFPGTKPEQRECNEKQRIWETLRQIRDAQRSVVSITNDPGLALCMAEAALKDAHNLVIQHATGKKPSDLEPRAVVYTAFPNIGGNDGYL